MHGKHKRPAFKEPDQELWSHFSYKSTAKIKLSSQEVRPQVLMPVRSRIFNQELTQVTRQVLAKKKESNALQGAETYIAKTDPLPAPLPLHEISTDEILNRLLLVTPFPRGPELQELLHGLYSGNLAALKGLSELLLGLAAANAMTWLIYDEQNACFDTVYACGLDDVTARNLYFSRNDPFLGQGDESIQFLRFTSSLKQNADFARRFSTRFLNTYAGMYIINLNRFHQSARLLLFYRHEPEEQELESTILPYILDLISCIQSMYEQNIVESKWDNNTEYMFFQLKEFQKLESQFMVLHYRLEGSLPGSKACWQILNEISESLLRHERAILRLPGILTILCSAERYVLLASAMQNISYRHGISCQKQAFKGPDFAANLYSYLSDWFG